MPPDSPNPSPTQGLKPFGVPGYGELVRFEDHQRLLQAEVEKREEVEEEARDLEAASIQRGDRVIELERRWVDVRQELKRCANNARIPVHAQNAYLAAAKLLRDKGTEQVQTNSKSVQDLEQGGGDSGVGAGDGTCAGVSLGLPRQGASRSPSVDSGVAIEGDEGWSHVLYREGCIPPTQRSSTGKTDP